MKNLQEESFNDPLETFSHTFISVISRSTQCRDPFCSPHFIFLYLHISELLQTAFATKIHIIKARMCSSSSAAHSFPENRINPKTKIIPSSSPWAVRINDTGIVRKRGNNSKTKERN